MTDVKDENIAGDLLTCASDAEAAVIADIVKEHIEPRTMKVTADGKTAEVLVLPRGLGAYSVKKYIDEFRTAPERRKGTSNLTELDSFIALTKRFLDEDSALFADRNPTAPSLVAVLDYHEMTAKGSPRFGTHRARYAFPLSDEWMAWTEGNGKWRSQADFAAFLEERIADVLDPLGDSVLATTRALGERLLCKFASPSRLMDLARGLSIRVNSIVANAQNLSSGEATIRFETTHSDDKGAPLDVPGAFVVQVPVFRSGAGYQIGARLRYHHKDGKLSWKYDLYRVTETFDHAFGEACERAAKETELPLYYGTPEA